MTTIVGITYPNGLVMASDLLVTYEGKQHRREEYRKLYFNDGLVVGYTGGTIGYRFKEIGKDTEELLSRYSIDALVRGQFVRFINSVNQSMLNKLATHVKDLDFIDFIREVDKNLLSALIGSYYKQSFPLWYYRKLANRKFRIRDGIILSTRDGEQRKFISAVKDIKGPQALELAISKVRDNNRRYPELSSGLEAVQMTRDSTKMVIYEHISK